MTSQTARFALAAALALGALNQSMHARALPTPHSANTRVEAFSTDTFKPIIFEAGQEATVTVNGDGDTDLDLYIYDSNNNLVAQDQDSTDRCVASWVPRSTGAFRIVVKNRGRIFNRYTMQTN